MLTEQFLILDVQKRAIQQIYDEGFVNSEPEEVKVSPVPEEAIIPPKPRHSLTALLSWWLGIRLVKTGRRFLQYAG